MYKGLPYLDGPFAKARYSKDYFGRGGGLTNRLKSVGGLTFFKDYRNAGPSLDADFALGLRTATYTAARSASAPATYVDSNGVIQLLTTSNVRRWTGGYYDETGFHLSDDLEGEMIEAAGTNMLKASNTFDATAWTDNTLNITLSSDSTLAPDGTTAVLATITNATNRLSYVLTVLASTVYTFSFFVKKGTATELKYSAYDKTGSADIVAKTSYYSSLGAGWGRISLTFTTPVGCTSVQVYISRDSGTGTFYAFGAQCEASPYATSFIPTTTAALTRAADNLNYLTSGNRTGATESIFIKFSPENTFANDGIYNTYMDSDADRRLMGKFNTDTKMRIRPNTTDSAAVELINTTTTPQKNVSYVYAVTMNTTGDPNVSAYINGSAEGTLNDDWTTTTFGTKMYIGSNLTPNSQAQAVIQCVAIYNRALSAAEVLTVTNIINSGGV